MRSETDKAYLAGLVDGEGHITLTKSSQRNGSIRYTLTVGVTNTHRATLEAIAAEWNGNLTEQRHRTDRGRPILSVVWGAQKAARVLEAIQPYMRIKSEQCRVALEFMATANPPEHRSRSVTDEVRARRHELKAELQRLNGRFAIIPVEKEEKPPLTCQLCGVEFTTYQKLRKYCSQTCTLRAGRQAYLDRIRIDKKCPDCGTAFTTSRKTQVYCSAQCGPHGQRSKKGLVPQGTKH